MIKDLGRVVGKSAYEIACDNGFVGTEQEWLDSLDGSNYDDTELKALIETKVDKENGKQLSTNDFTDEEKSKLESLNNYDDSELQNQITQEIADRKSADTTIQNSISTTVNNAIAEIIANSPADFDTLKEIADWIDTHEDSASAMNTAIQENKTLINNKADKTSLINWNIANTNYTGNPNDCEIGKWYSINTSSYSTNMPEINGWSAIITFAANNNASYKKQICFYSNGARLFTRSCIGGTWGTWKKVVQQDDLSSYAKTNHSHNDLYYTESEIDTKLSNKADKNGSTADFQANNHFYKSLGTWKDYEQVVIPILEITASTAANRYSNGKIFSHRDNGLYTDPIVEWKCNKTYNATASEKYNLVAYKLNHFKFATFEYDEKKYLGVVWNYTPSQPIHCYFGGYTNNMNSPMFTVIPYYNSNTKIVLNEEIKNSLVEITSYDYGALATKSVNDKNGNDITTTYATKSLLDTTTSGLLNQVAMTLNNYVSKSNNANNVMGSGSKLDFKTNKAELILPVYEANETTPTTEGSLYIKKGTSNANTNVIGSGTSTNNNGYKFDYRYRVGSDGFIQIWGTVKNASTVRYKSDWIPGSFQLPVAMANSNYVISITNEVYNVNVAGAEYYIKNKTTQAFEFAMYNRNESTSMNGNTANIYICGQVAQ